VSWPLASIDVGMFLMPSSLLLDIRWRSLAIDGRLVAAGPQVTRKANQFNGLPIIEMAKLFAGIFITLIPAIAILRAGSAGVLAPVVDMVSEGGEQVNLMYFWATGILSRFLDNTPTYLVFFNTAAGDAELLTGPLSTTLLAISAGAVFMGANT
jgi:Na+/H+ antiporter NhaD/arsenite permease-like protein